MFDLYDDIYSTEELVGMESANITIDKCLLALDAFNESYELDCREMELRCMMESGSNEELMDFYEEAAEKLDTKKESILKRAWKALKDLIRKIKEAIFGKKTKPNLKPSDKVVVKKPFAKFVKGIKSAWSAVKSAVLNIGKSLKNHKGILALIALISAALIGGAVVHKRKTAGENLPPDAEEVTVKEVADAKDTCKDIVDAVETVVEKAESNVSAANEENIQVLQEVVNTVEKGSAQCEQVLQLPALLPEDREIEKAAEDLKRNPVNRSANRYRNIEGWKNYTSQHDFGKELRPKIPWETVEQNLNGRTNAQLRRIVKNLILDGRDPINLTPDEKYDLAGINKFSRDELINMCSSYSLKYRRP